MMLLILKHKFLSLLSSMLIKVHNIKLEIIGDIDQYTTLFVNSSTKIDMALYYTVYF